MDFGRYKHIIRSYFSSNNSDTTLSTPIWCLGCRYDPVGAYRCAQILHDTAHDVEDHEQISSGQSEDVPYGNGETEIIRHCVTPCADLPTDFVLDAGSRFWMTYRSNFSPIARSAEASMTLSVRLRSLTEPQGFISDTGWGCMIRSGQCVLANSLATLILGRDWRRGLSEIRENKIIAWFADDPAAPFSIHKFVDHGAKFCDKHPGEWFGPSATARCIQALTLAYPDCNMNVYMNSNGADVYVDKFLSICKNDEGIFRPTLILLGVRLGIEHVTPAYRDSLKKVLRIPQSMGIAGGRPGSSHYFFAEQGDRFFYLDPHYTRLALPLRENSQDYTAEEIASCHTQHLQSLHISEMDPSMLLAFLIKDENDWQQWRRHVQEMESKAIIHIMSNAHMALQHNEAYESSLKEVTVLDDEDEEGCEN